jgi:hypothetical protein
MTDGMTGGILLVILALCQNPPRTIVSDTQRARSATHGDTWLLQTVLRVAHEWGGMAYNRLIDASFEELPGWRQDAFR